MLNFLFGLICMGYLVSSLFFVKFWKKSGDRLLLAFAGAFAVLALERIVLVTFDTNEYQPYVYVPRMLAFLIIVVAVADKNRT